MSIYSANGTELLAAYDADGLSIDYAYDENGNEVFAPQGEVTENYIYNAVRSSQNLYGGGYIEIQPDSWDGSTVCTGDIVQPTDSTAWGFPMSLSSASKLAIKNEILRGQGKGISFIRFPMGFAYRGYRNIDQTTGLAKNIGQRWEGQNTALNDWFSSISAVGGGLSVEYWCPAPYWLTGGAYYNPNVNNELWAGGTYSRTTTLESIKTTDSTQYAAQIDAFTDAIVNDLEYVHQNVAPVRMYTLAAEPTGSGQLKYGHCHWSTTVYNDVFAVLHPKVMQSATLATYNGKPNSVLMHLCADDEGFGIGLATINNNPSWPWGYSHDVMRPVSGENGDGADTLLDLSWPSGANQNWKNVFICEYEYFSSTSKPDSFKCGNNIVRLLLELAVRKAKVVMPVIHICKPTGQSSSMTNTNGYCIYAVNMSDGSYATNPWSYNSWKMINDNLDVGSLLVSGGATNVSKTAYAVYDYDSKTKVFIGNYNSSEITATIATSGQHSVVCKLYNLDSVGIPQTTEADGNNIVVTVPAYSGVVIVADEQMTVSGVTAEQEEVTPQWEAGYINDSGALSTNTGSYVATAYTEASGTIRIQTSYGVQNIRLAEYDASKNFIQREYTSGGDSTFTLNANTRFVRIGFKFTTDQSESVVDALFKNGYTFTQL